MSKRMLDHLRSNVIGCLALFLALSMGTAYATHKGGANTISSGDIIDGEVKNPDIGANAVTGDKVLNRSISFGDLAADSIFSGHIATGQVQSIDVRNDDLTGFDIANTSSLGGAEINEGDLTAGGVLSGTLASAQFAPSSVDTQSLASDAVDEQKIKDGAVKEGEIDSGAVKSEEIATSAVDTSEIADDAVSTTEIAPNAVESTEIAADAVDTSELASNSVDSAEIAPSAIGTSEIGNIPAALALAGGDTNVPDSTRTTVDFNLTVEDTANMHSGAQGSTITAPVDGIYSISASFYWQVDETPSGFRETAIVCGSCQVPGGFFDGSTEVFLAHSRLPAEGAGGGVPSSACGICEGFVEPNHQPGSLSTIAKLRAGESIKVVVWQNSGEAQSIRGFARTTGPGGEPILSPSLSMTWIAPTS